MENLSCETPYKNQNDTSEDIDSKLIIQKLNDNLPADKGKQKLTKLNRYSLFVKNLVKSKRFKSTEKRRKKESIDEQEKKKEKKPIYLNKYRRISKPKVTFQTTSKNPKINEILKKLRESEERGNTVGKNNVNVGKIDSNKINKFLGFRDSQVNNDIENNFHKSKVKNYVEQLNKKIMMDKTSSEDNKNRTINKIKKNLKEKEFKEENKENSRTSSDDEYKSIRKDKMEYSNNNQEILKDENSNNFNIKNTVEEKYINQKNNIDYFKFSFNSYTINDKNYKKKKKSNPILYLPKNQISFSILSEISLSKPRKKSFIYPKRKKSIKTKNKSKKSSDNLNETEGKEKVKLYEIVGFDHKKRRMSILDILKKRKISIISEDQLPHNRTKVSRSIKLVNKEKNINIEEKPEIVKYNDMVKYIVYTSVTTIKKNGKFNLKELVMTKVIDIQFIVKKTDNNINKDDKKENDYMKIEKKNDIDIVGNKKGSFNSIKRKKISFHGKENNSSSLINTKNNKEELRISLDTDNKIKITKENKSTGRRHLKSFLIFESLSSSNEDVEKDQSKDKKTESKNDKKQLTNSKRLNPLDELFHIYTTNYKEQKIKKKISKSMEEEEIINKINISKKNKPLKKNMERKSIYTDTETNKSRALFKKKLLASNKLIDDIMSLSKTKVSKIKTNKAKIKKFISKKDLKEKKSFSFEKRKNINLKNKKPTDKNAKIKQFHGQRNINTDYINNSNIILQNTTVNHTTYNYYLNDQDKSKTSKKNNNYKKKK